MKRKRHTPEQIIRKLRTAEQLLNQGKVSPMFVVPWRSRPRPITVGRSCTEG